MSSARLQIASPDEWSFDGLPPDRRAYLERDTSFEEIARAVADLAIVETACVDPLDTEGFGAPRDTTWRAWFTIRIENKEISDLYYNGRDGLRGRYWQSEDAGNAATALSIKLISQKLLEHAAGHCEGFDPATLTRGDVTQVARSLRGPSAKTWAYEKPDQNFNEGPKLIVRQWANNRPGGNWRWAPVGPLLDIKGAFYTPLDSEHVPPNKVARAYSIHRYGFS